MPILTNGPSRILGGARGLAVPVPVLGPELLQNGNFEAWSSATNAETWTESTSGTSAITRNSTDQYAGANCLQIAVDGSNSSVYVLQGSTSAGKWYHFAIWGELLSGTGSMNFGKLNETRTVSLSSTYTQYVFAHRATSAGGFIISRASAANASYVVDDFSAKEITLASMFSARAYTTHATTKARVTVVPGTRAGVVVNLDSATAPANAILASVDGSTARMTKLVNGVYTELVSQAVAYVAGAFVEVRRLAGTDTWQLWYNGAQVGANQTISDTAIKAAVLHGYFNTYAGNLLSEFSCVASA